MRGPEKRGPCESALRNLSGLVTYGCYLVKDDLEFLGSHIPLLRQIEALLLPSDSLTLAQRKQTFDEKALQLFQAPHSVYIHIGSAMRRWGDQLFPDFEDLSLPVDNLDLERHFKLPKHFDRRITGGERVRKSLVRTGETLIPALDAHTLRTQPFLAVELLPYVQAPVPPGQLEATRRHSLMRQARSEKALPILLNQLEQRYRLGVAQSQLPQPEPRPTKHRTPTMNYHPQRRSVRMCTSRRLPMPNVSNRPLLVEAPRSDLN